MVETDNFLSCTAQTRAQKQVTTGLKFIELQEHILQWEGHAALLSCFP